MVTVAVAGGAGYIGGELVRLLLGHPQCEISAVTSERLTGKRVDTVHPNLRGLTGLRFSAAGDMGDPDVLLVAGQHGQSMTLLPDLARRAKCVIDLSGDFRLRDAAAYEDHYGVPHTAPELLPAFVTGLPELHREELRVADRVSVPGCMATAAILALAPVTELVTDVVQVDARCGSSGAGSSGAAGMAGLANTHAERSGAMRVFAPVRHRHEAEITQATGLSVRMSATGVEAVRGVQVLCRATVEPGTGEAAIRAAYRNAFAGEPFVRVVAHSRGQYRYPEPKILLGSNFCDVGFAVEQETGRLTLIAALDNLVKGGAGNAVQCLNIRHGWPERLGLEFPGLHPN